MTGTTVCSRMVARFALGTPHGEKSRLPTGLSGSVRGIHTFSVLA
jgi:hypothetical protein